MIVFTKFLFLTLLTCTSSIISFEQWKRDYSVSYASSDEEHRRKIVWEKNVREFGVNALNPFTDLIAEETEFPTFEQIFPSSDEIKYPFKAFSESYVKKALRIGKDWRTEEAVTIPKNQGPHGYCGTFARVSVAESQYHLRGGYKLTNFSVEQLVDCVGWAKDQFPSFFHTGFEMWDDYPFNVTKYPDNTPPPCELNKTKIIPHTTFSNFTTVPGSAGEDQMAAFVFKNGPAQVGIWAEQFGKVGADHFVGAKNCTSENSINHSVNIVGFGTNEKWGDYWIIKNSWTSTWQDGGFIYLQRGVNCGSITKAGASTFTYGDPSLYYE